ncbi:uncharacterized protein [Nicotiana tomentosiformis]|uniref:uncharacterized protein n=1 Tax=Nicotiana tomentosiformis TaxID=4098 RepID=UPI001444E6A4|nr:uncharacterized protein LOC117273134 [Nicotiana tomentosiformis]
MFHDQPIAENAGSKSATLKHSSLFSEGEKVPANNGSGVREVGQGSIVVMSQHRPVVNAIVVPVTAAINRVASDLKDATGSVLDRGSAGASKGLIAGQKSYESGHQTSHGQGQTSIQKLKEGKEKGAGQVLDFSSKSGAVPAEKSDAFESVSQGAKVPNGSTTPLDLRGCG